MLKGIKYNQNYKKKRGKSVYTQEHNAISDFEFVPDKHNLRFEYNDKKEAINAGNQLRRYVKETKKQLVVLQRENFVFVVKEKEDTNEQS